MSEEFCIFFLRPLFFCVVVSSIGFGYMHIPLRVDEDFLRARNASNTGFLFYEPGSASSGVIKKFGQNTCP